MDAHINGKTKTMGLMGCPVEHTLSPVIHNNMAEKLGINMVYVPFLVQPEDVEAAVRGAHALHIGGLNVTVPHKEAVIPALARIDKLAENIGAVNTLVFEEDGYKGYNTDVLGLKRAMSEDGISMEQRTVAVIGAGGAGKAIAYMCAAEDTKKVYLLNRSVEKAQKLEKEINRKLGTQKVTALGLDEWKTIEENNLIVIQATSFGLYPNIEDTPIKDAEFFKKIDTAVDIIYRPAETKFMRLVKENGGRAFNGLKMLLYQGVIAFELWNRVQVDEETCQWLYGLLEEEVRVDEG